MNTLIIIGIILAMLGIFGSLVPAFPGPSLSFAALILLYFGKPGVISFWPLIFFGLGMVFLILIDYAAPILGAKFSGASRKGLIGSIIGCFAGIFFFPPFGIFLGAFIGAFLGEIIEKKDPLKAWKAGLGTFFGSVTVIILQGIYSFAVAVYFILKLFN